MKRASIAIPESSTFDRIPIVRRRHRAHLDRRLLRALLATLSLLLVSLATVAVFPGGGLALALVGFGILFALPFAIVRGLAGSLHPAQ